MQPGDKFAVMFVPSTVQQVLENPAFPTLFSLSSDKSQIADLTGKGTTFGMEEQLLTNSKGDYQDLISQIKGATVKAPLLDKVIDPQQNWQDTPFKEALLNNAKAGDEGAILESVPDAVKYAVERSTNLKYYDSEALAKTQQWVVGITPGQSSSQLATLFGAQDFGATGHIPNAYIWELPKQLPPTEIAKRLDATSGIEFVYPLVDIQLKPLSEPLLNQQWHLQNTGQTGGKSGVDANVPLAWNSAKGNGIVIGIVDDGLQYTHPDLSDRYIPSLSRDFNQVLDIKNRIYDPDPAPFSQDAIAAEITSPQPIKDEKLTKFTLHIGLTGVVKKATVNVDITHPFPEELNFYLIRSNPESPTFQLPSINSSGKYSFDTSLFNGEYANGKWMLQVHR